MPNTQLIADHAADLALAQEETLARTTELNKVLAVASKERAKRVELESDLNSSRCGVGSERLQVWSRI